MNAWRRFQDRLRNTVELGRSARDELRRYRAAANLSPRTGTPKTPEHLGAEIDRLRHRIEKGLSLPSPRRPFGAETAISARGLMRLRAPDPPEELRSAVEALEAWNTSGKVDPDVSPICDRAHAPIEPDAAEALFAERHSTRSFLPRPVPPELVQRAIAWASCTPSACDLRPWRVRLLSEGELPPLLALQNGNRGFAQEIRQAALITVDLRGFAGPYERGQALVEGGMFAMSLVWAFQAAGVGTCVLNLSLPPERARRMRETAGVPSAEQLVVLIAFGWPRPGHRRTRSSRAATSRIVLRGGHPQMRD